MNRIQELRETLGISRNELAQAISTNAAAVWRWEKDVFDINQTNLIKLADYFEVSIDYLVGREGDNGVIVSNTNLSPLSSKALSLFDKLPLADKNKVIGYLEALTMKS
jgi:transcriptional regulator with XRE-family HTH domain